MGVVALGVVVFELVVVVVVISLTVRNVVKTTTEFLFRYELICKFVSTKALVFFFVFSLILFLVIDNGSTDTKEWRILLGSRRGWWQR